MASTALMGQTKTCKRVASEGTCPCAVDPSDTGQKRHVLSNPCWFRHKDLSLL